MTSHASACLFYCVLRQWRRGACRSGCNVCAVGATSDTQTSGKEAFPSEKLLNQEDIENSSACTGLPWKVPPHAAHLHRLDNFLHLVLRDPTRKDSASSVSVEALYIAISGRGASPKPADSAAVAATAVTAVASLYLAIPGDRASSEDFPTAVAAALVTSSAPPQDTASSTVCSMMRSEDAL